MAHAVLQTLRVRPYTDPKVPCRQDLLILLTQILHMSLVNSSDLDSVKQGKLAPSHTRLMSQPSIRLVNTLPRYDGPISGPSSRSCTDSSARGTASSEQNAHWHTSCRMEEGSIDPTYLLEGSSILAAGWIPNYTSSQILLWHIRF